jgi:Holliday junction resolvasome RuvABC DNA-binding subunit
MGVRDPEAALKQQAPPVPQGALDMLVQMGFDKRLIEYAVQSAQQADPQLQQGPSTDQVTQMMGDPSQQQQDPQQQADPQGQAA